MTGILQPLDNKFAIVDRHGNPTDYFIRWAQQKQIDIGSSITLTDLANYLAAHKLASGQGIALTPDGNLADSPSISILNGTGLDFDVMHNLKLADTAVAPGTYGDATHVPAIVVDQQGRITGVTLVAISGGGGSSLYPLTAPNNALFSWLNQGGATVTVNSSGSISLRAPKSAGQNLRCRIMPLVAAPYTATVGFISSMRARLDFQAAGILLYDSVSGKIKTWNYDVETANSYFTAQNWNSATAINSNIFAPIVTNGGYGPLYMRLVDDGTNLLFQASEDGYQFVQYGSIARTTFVTPTHVGFYAWEGTNTYENVITAFHWTLTQP